MKSLLYNYTVRLLRKDKEEKSMNKKVIIVVGILVVIIIGIVVYLFMQSSEDQTTAEPQNIVSNEAQEEKFSVSYQNVDITPGQPFDADAIAEEAEYSQIPSCAFEGTDNVSTYAHVEVTSAQINGKETVYSVYFLDDEVSTPEGVKITDDRAKVIETYGDNYEEAGNKITYTRGDVQLSFMIENDVVTSIEYVYASEL